MSVGKKVMHLHVLTITPPHQIDRHITYLRQAFDYPDDCTCIHIYLPTMCHSLEVCMLFIRAINQNICSAFGQSQQMGVFQNN